MEGVEGVASTVVAFQVMADIPRAAVTEAVMEVTIAAAILVAVATTAGAAGMGGEADIGGATRATVMDGDGAWDLAGRTGGDIPTPTATVRTILRPRIPTILHTLVLRATPALTTATTIPHRQTPIRTPDTPPQNLGDLPCREAELAQTLPRAMRRTIDRVPRFYPLTT
jgi:hypothetical protein